MYIFLRPHDFNFQHKNKKITYQIIFFKRLIKNRGIWEAWIFRWKTKYDNYRVLLLAFNIHLRKTIPKSQIG